MLPQMRSCPECKGVMEFKLITMNYEDPNLSIIIRISGIPALACTECGFELISIQLAKSLDSLKKQQPVIKALPKVNINFAFDENALAVA